MNKTITVPQNIAQEAISVHEKKTSFADIRNLIVAEEADEKYEQTTRFPGIIGNSIVAEEAIDVHEQKTSFADIRNLIVAEEADEKYKQKTRFPGIIGNSIVAEEAIDVHEQKTSFADIRNLIVAEEADEKYEQKTRFPGIIRMNSRGCIVPCARFFAVACGDDISCTHVEIPSAENKIGIMHSSKGVPA